MDLRELVAHLSRADAWPDAARVEVEHTHISVVFLTETRAYKVRKPVDLGFLDFSSLALRRADCEAEVRINARYAPGVYLGVVELRADGDRVRLGGSGEVVEVAVEMVRLPAEATLDAMISRGAADEALLRRIGHRLAALHRSAARSPEISRYGRLEVVAANAMENFDQSVPEVGLSVHARVHARLREVTDTELARLGPLIDARADEGVPCDTHGDLRAKHVYLVDGELLFLDCIEFNERFRYADPVADVAFLAMDLAVRGCRDLARALVDAWLEASGDAGARPLFALYQSYRAAVRAKVAGFELRSPEIPEPSRHRALARARAHWLYALEVIEQRSLRPCVVGIGGLPGVGKSTLARALSARAGLEVVRSDLVRKELAGLAPDESARAPVGEGLYTDAARDEVYRACLDRAEAIVFSGGRAIIDASFATERWRHALFARAASLGVPGVLLLCDVDAEVARARLAARVGDASDADVHVYDAAVRVWEPLGDATCPVCDVVRTDGDDAPSLALAVLEARGLA